MTSLGREEREPKDEGCLSVRERSGVMVASLFLCGHAGWEGLQGIPTANMYSVPLAPTNPMYSSPPRSGPQMVCLL